MHFYHILFINIIINFNVKVALLVFYCVFFSKTGSVGHDFLDKNLRIAVSPPVSLKCSPFRGLSFLRVSYIITLAEFSEILV